MNDARENITDWILNKKKRKGPPSSFFRSFPLHLSLPRQMECAHWSSRHNSSDDTEVTSWQLSKLYLRMKTSRLLIFHGGPFMPFKLLLLLFFVFPIQGWADHTVATPPFHSRCGMSCRTCLRLSIHLYNETEMKHDNGIWNLFLINWVCCDDIYNM